MASQERLRVVAEARQAKEEEERKMREAEEAAAAEAKRAKDEARQKELEELQVCGARCWEGVMPGCGPWDRQIGVQVISTRALGKYNVKTQAITYLSTRLRCLWAFRSPFYLLA